MLKIIPGLFIGGCESLNSPDLKQVTHVLSVINYEPEVDASAYSWKHIHLEDSEDANLLELLPEAVELLHRVLYSWGSVLVTCHAGTSRSVAVCMAYLMRRRTLTVETALEVVREVVPGAQPNIGFMEQLQLWYDMGFKLDAWHPDYKRWSLLQFGNLWRSQGYIKESSLRSVPDYASPGTQQLAAYRCRKCRRMLATTLNVVPVGAPGKVVGRAHRFGVKKGQKGRVRAEAEADESSLFVEPLKWMLGEIVGLSQGKLHCPSCGSRLGSFNWAGITNAAGVWVTPAFQLHVSRMDLIEPKAPAVLLNVCQPCFGHLAAGIAPADRPPALPPSSYSTAAVESLPTGSAASSTKGSLQVPGTRGSSSHGCMLPSSSSSMLQGSAVPFYEQGTWLLFEEDLPVPREGIEALS